MFAPGQPPNPAASSFETDRLTTSPIQRRYRRSSGVGQETGVEVSTEFASTRHDQLQFHGD